MTQSSPDFEAWVAEARGADCWEVLCRIRPGHGVKLSRNECVGPCPACGGRDRFSINRRKNVWHCRQGGGTGAGGDAIALVMYLDGADFLGACEIITGEPPPRGERGRKADPDKVKRDQERIAQERLKREAEANDFRAREINRARKIWNEACAFPGTLVEDYLRFRGLEADASAWLRFHKALPYWHFIDGEWREIARGPAMIGAIAGNDGAFIGSHCTWLDASLASGSGKAEIIHPLTGEILDAKKFRGSAKGGHIHLAGRKAATHLVIGEGIETALSVRERARAHLADAVFWSGLSLGNIGGRARESVVHPTLTKIDSRGRSRRAKVPGPLPDMGDTDALRIPDSVTTVLLLGDGDSDAFSTRQVLLRAAARWAKPGRLISAAWAHAGEDFNSMLRGAA